MHVFLKKERNNNWSGDLPLMTEVIILARIKREEEGESGQIDAILVDYVLSDVVNPALNESDKAKTRLLYIYIYNSCCHVLNLMILCALNNFFFFKITHSFFLGLLSHEILVERNFGKFVWTQCCIDTIAILHQ